MENFLSRGLIKHALLDGEYNITIDFNAGVSLKDGRLSFEVKTDGGQQQRVTLSIDGPHSGIVRRDLQLLSTWVEAVGADVSDEALQGNPTRIVSALAYAGRGKSVVGTFSISERNNQRYSNLVGVRVDGVLENDEGYDEQI